jgi:hypothetical protein
MPEPDPLQIIQHHAPALAKTLQRVLGSLELRDLVHDLEAVVALGGAHERGIVREPGVSFNPRLGRLLALLIKEGGFSDLLSMRAVLWSSVVTPPELDQVPDQQVRTVVAQVVGAAACGAQEQSRVNAMRGVLLLDSVRHLHLSTISREEKERLLDEGERQLAVAGADALHAKLSYALAAQRRLLSGA